MEDIVEHWRNILCARRRRADRYRRSSNAHATEPRRPTGSAPQTGFIARVLRSDGEKTPVGIAGVDHDRLTVLGAHFPARIEAGIVGLNVTADPVLELESENLVDLQARRPSAEAALQFRSGL